MRRHLRPWLLAIYAGFALLVPWVLWQWAWACLLGLGLICGGVIASGPED